MSIKHLLVLGLAGVSAFAHAGSIVGGSALVDAGGLSKLEAWLGQGQLTLTNIYTKQQGHTSNNFHAAVDGKGATFSLMSASEDGGLTWKTIGGYNPLSWSSSNGYNYSNLLADFDAFIFNLSDNTRWSQTANWQTYNHSSYGPAFGGGHDIWVNFNLSSGYSYRHSYGGYCSSGATGCSNYGSSIVDGSAYNGHNMLIGQLEIFSISEFIAPPSSDVPAPASLALAGLSLLLLAGSQRRR